MPRVVRVEKSLGVRIIGAGFRCKVFSIDIHESDLPEGDYERLRQGMRVRLEIEIENHDGGD